MSDNPEPGARAPDPAALTLDSRLVLGALGIVAAVLVGLFLLDVPQSNLAIIASIVASIGSVVSAYAGYRWGASDAMKRAAQPGGER